MNMTNASTWLKILIEEFNFHISVHGNEKVHKFAMITSELVMEFGEGLPVGNLLSMGNILRFLVDVAMEPVDKLLKLIHVKIEEGVRDVDVNALYRFTRNCLVIFPPSDLEKLVRPLANRHPLGKTIHAKMLFDMEKYHESEQLFLEYLSSLPPSTPIVYRATAEVYNYLRILCY